MLSDEIRTPFSPLRSFLMFLMSGVNQVVYYFQRSHSFLTQCYDRAQEKPRRIDSKLRVSLKNRHWPKSLNGKNKKNVFSPFTVTDQLSLHMQSV